MDRTQRKDSCLEAVVFGMAMASDDVLSAVDADDFQEPFKTLIANRKSRQWPGVCDRELKAKMGVHRASKELLSDAILGQFRTVAEWRRQNRESGKVDYEARFHALVASRRQQSTVSD